MVICQKFMKGFQMEIRIIDAERGWIVFNDEHSAHANLKGVELPNWPEVMSHLQELRDYNLI